MPKANERVPKLQRLQLSGFKSIEHLDLTFTQLDVLIGPNGSGKSSLVGFLQMVGFMLSSEGGLATFVSQSGGASKLLHDGPKRTPQIEANITIETGLGTNDYSFRLGYASGDTLIFLDERCRFSSTTKDSPNQRWLEFGAGHRYPQLLNAKTEKNPSQKTKITILRLLQGLSTYQFHDTSPAARIKQKWQISDNRDLKGDGANLAAFLLGMRNRSPEHYRRVVETVRLVAPFFDDFVLEPDHRMLLLQWREIASDIVFDPGQISDGSLRLIALLALLLQPLDQMPPMLILDEPELGLHPAAVRIIAGALKAVSETHQCLVATQSQQLLNEFGVDDIIVVERKRRGSEFRRLTEDEFATWLEDYTLSDLWDMNLLGGRPEPMAAE